MSIAAILASVALAAYASFSSWFSPCNGLVCGPIPYPKIQSQNQSVVSASLRNYLKIVDEMAAQEKESSTNG